MTKKQWNNILERLKGFRDSNKFRTPICYDDRVIDKVDTTENYIRFQGREYIRHSDVININPKRFIARFTIIINPFDVTETKF